MSESLKFAAVLITALAAFLGLGVWLASPGAFDIHIFVYTGICLLGIILFALLLKAEQGRELTEEELREEYEKRRWKMHEEIMERRKRDWSPGGASYEAYMDWVERYDHHS